MHTLGKWGARKGEGLLGYYGAGRIEGAGRRLKEAAPPFCSK